MEFISQIRHLAGFFRRNRACLAVLAASLFSASAWAQINLVNVTTCGPQNFPGSTCTLPATGTGNLLVVAWMSNNGGGSATITGINDNASGGGNSYLQVPNARAVNSGPNTMADIWYAKNTRPGATILTLTPNPSGLAGTAVVWEFAGVDATAPLDQSSALNTQTSTTIVSGAPVNTISANSLIISIANFMGTVAGIDPSSSFTNDSTVNGNGWAHRITSSPGSYMAQWNTSLAGTYGSSTVSFKASSSGGGPVSGCDLTQDGGVNSADVIAAVDMALGLTPCTANIIGLGVCNVVVVQRVINAAAPGGTCVVGNSHTVALNWVTSTSPNVTGTNVYRGTTSGGPYTKLTSSPVSGISYTDSTAQAGQIYYYVVTAVDANGIESAYSTPASAAVPSS